MTEERAFSVGSGPLFAELGNAISDAINAALTRGMETDEACSIAMKVLSDYWRFAYGSKGLDGLASLLAASKSCECYRCLSESGSTVTLGGLTVPITSARMIVCETCGNKRCPHGSDHRLICTGDNEPGQNMFAAVRSLEALNQAADPETVLSLLDDRSASQAELVRLREAVADFVRCEHDALTIGGLMDCRDNTGAVYQSADLAAVIARALRPVEGA